MRLADVPDAIIGYTDPKVSLPHCGALTIQSEAKGDKNKKLVEKAPDAAEIRQSKAWDAAMTPVKSIPMNAMMLYMSGNSVQIFSMMTVYMMVSNPIRGLTSINQGMLKRVRLMR